MKHGHCPLGHDHPQEFRGVPTKGQAEFFYCDPSIEQEFCTACWFRDDDLVALVPCACDDPG